MYSFPYVVNTPGKMCIRDREGMIPFEEMVYMEEENGEGEDIVQVLSCLLYTSRCV